MRLVLTTVFVLALANSAFASEMPAYFKAVSESYVLQQIVSERNKENWHLMKLENTAVYRCPGCYEFEVTLSKNDGEGNLYQQHLLATRFDLQSQQIKVELKRD